MVLSVVVGGIFSATSLATNSPALPVLANGMDTIAGSSTIITSSKTAPNANVVFEMGKPDGSAVSFSSVADSSGIAKVMVSGENTKTAGLYTIRTKVNGSSLSDDYTNFVVLAGSASQTNSKITPSDQVVSSLDGTASITVTIFDNYENPISGHVVKLISSGSDNEVISSSSTVTDENGQIEFTVVSRKIGATVYTAYNSTADFVLNGKARVAYFDDSSYIISNNIPSNYAYASSGNSSGVADHFSFEEVPMIINSGESISFKLTAYDVNDQVVMNYAGITRFSVESGNPSYVTLPGDYAFIPEDLGSHTFSVALGFLQPGSYQLRAQDITNPSIYGQFIFVVGGGGSAQGGVVMASPISGSYGNNVHVVSGTASPGAKLKIFDGQIELTSLVADINGTFSYTTGLLADGLHRFSVVEVNDVGAILSTSNVAEVNISTAGVSLTNLTLTPSSIVDAGTLVTVKISASAKLSKASLQLANNIYELAVDPTGGYTVQFQAPLEFGDYPLVFVLKDELGNESRVDNKGFLTVKGSLIPETVVVPDVSGLVATSEDKRVILNWNAVSASTNPIPHYRVYVGSAPLEMTMAIDTFTNATTWYVPNLENGKEYYFAVVAVDNKGNTSPYLSNIVSATPNPLIVEVEDVEVDFGIGGEDAFDEMEEDPSEAGPEILWLVLVSALGGIFYSETARRRKV